MSNLPKGIRRDPRKLRLRLYVSARLATGINEYLKRAEGTLVRRQVDG